MTKDTLCKKTNMNHVIRKPSVFLFLCHAGRHCHVGVSNGGKRKRSVKLSFLILIMEVITTTFFYLSMPRQNQSPFLSSNYIILSPAPSSPKLLPNFHTLIHAPMCTSLTIRLHCTPTPKPRQPPTKHLPSSPHHEANTFQPHLHLHSIPLNHLPKPCHLLLDQARALMAAAPTCASTTPPCTQPAPPLLLLHIRQKPPNELPCTSTTHRETINTTGASMMPHLLPHGAPL